MRVKVKREKEREEREGNQYMWKKLMVSRFFNKRSRPKAFDMLKRLLHGRKKNHFRPNLIFLLTTTKTMAGPLNKRLF